MHRLLFQISHFVHNYFFGFQLTAGGYRNKFFYVSTILGLIFLASLTVFHFITQFFLLAFLELSLLVVTFVNLYFIFNRGKIVLSYRIALFINYIFYVSYYLFGASSFFGPLILLSFPLIALPLAGRKNGLAWILVFVLSLYGFKFVSLFGLLSLPYSFVFLVQLTISIFVFTLFLYLYQSLVEMHEKLIEDTTHELYKVNLQLHHEVLNTENLARQLKDSMQSHENQNRQLERTELATLNILEDLTEEKNEIALAKAKDDAILSSIGESVVVTDKNGVVLFVNKQVELMLGFLPEEIIGHKWALDVPGVVDARGNDVPLHNRVIVQALQESKQASNQYAYVCKDGTFLPVQVTAAPVIMNGEIIGGVVVFRDISHEREIDRMKDEFISLASHQLRTPATGVKAYISMLLDGYAGSVTDKQREFLTIAYSSNERQIQIVNDLLNIARIESGKIQLNYEHVNVAQLVDEIIHEQKRTIADKKQRLDYTHHHSEIYAYIDPSKIKMVVDNLINNASKYSYPGAHIVVSVDDHDVDFVITVKDTGVGIAQQDFDKLFKKFSQVSNPLSTTVNGSGLGLYLVKKMIDLHQGTIRVSSKLHEGTEFTITLPKGDMHG